MEDGTTTYSAKAPGMLTPMPRVWVQRWRLPARQLRQWPQVTWPSAETRSRLIIVDARAHFHDPADELMTDDEARR